MLVRTRFQAFHLTCFFRFPIARARLDRLWVEDPVPVLSYLCRGRGAERSSRLKGRLTDRSRRFYILRNSPLSIYKLHSAEPGHPTKPSYFADCRLPSDTLSRRELYLTIPILMLLFYPSFEANDANATPHEHPTRDKIHHHLSTTHLTDLIQAATLSS